MGYGEAGHRTSHFEGELGSISFSRRQSNRNNIRCRFLKTKAPLSGALLILFEKDTLTL